MLEQSFAVLDTTLPPSFESVPNDSTTVGS